MHTYKNLSPQLFTKRVLRWFEQHGRKHLPWQKNPTPYRVWISEIMLQQTQVSTVIPYFEKFIKQFPNVRKLANATEDEVLHLWTGLGYYSRARNILKSAKIIIEKYHGKFPVTLDEMQTLPGIGRSTAAAILALSMQQRAAILDGNVKRVLSRVSTINARENELQLWELAEKLTPTKNISEYTQAMMDLGAMVCTRSKPNCSMCPLTKMCLAFQQKRQHEFPGKRVIKKLPVKQIQLLLLKNKKNEILLEKRPSKGIWGGLWSLPEYQSEASLTEFCWENYRCKIKAAITQKSFRHTFTHFHLDITPIEITVVSSMAAKQTGLRWQDTQGPLTFGLAAPIKKLLAFKT